MNGRADIALVSLDTTMGLRSADEALAAQVEAAGASCELVRVRIGISGRLRRTMALTDLVEARAARRAARGVDARAVVYSTVTAALLQPLRAPYAVRFDGIAATNRPGIGGAWQRRREQRVLAGAALLLPWSEAARAAASVAAGSAAPAVVLPPPVLSADRPQAGAPDAVAYAANPDKRGLDLLCEAWAAAAPPGARLGISGLDRAEGVRWLRKLGTAEPAGVEWLPSMDPAAWRSLVSGARVFVNASRIEDWGIAQMEALASGTPLVTLPTPGPNPALALARELAPELVAGERTTNALAGALRAGLALDGPTRERYAARAAGMLEPYREESLRRTVAEDVLPRLLASSSP